MRASAEGSRDEHFLRAEIAAAGSLWCATVDPKSRHFCVRHHPSSCARRRSSLVHEHHQHPRQDDSILRFNGSPEHTGSGSPQEVSPRRIHGQEEGSIRHQRLDHRERPRLSAATKWQRLRRVQLHVCGIHQPRLEDHVRARSHAVLPTENGVRNRERKVDLGLLTGTKRGQRIINVNFTNYCFRLNFH